MLIRKISVLLLALSLGFGCATTQQAKEELIYWPSPPETPRIAFIKSYRGAVDFRKPSFFDTLFGAPASPRLKKPTGIFSHGGKIYASLTDSGEIAMIDPYQKKLDYLGDHGIGKLVAPLGLAGNGDGTIIYAADPQLRKVNGYDRNGDLRVSIGKAGELENPVGLAVNDMLGRIYIVDSKTDQVHVFSMKGENLFKFGKPGSADGDFHAPTSAAVDKRNGNIYVVDTLNFRVQVFDKDGKFLRKFGEVGDAPGTFSRPKGIAIDSEGHVYVTDAAFNNFQIFNEAGELLLFVGAPGVSSGHFFGPSGIYIDEQDRIYVADSLNSRVQVFQYLSEKWKKDNPDEYKKYALPE